LPSLSKNAPSPAVSSLNWSSWSRPKRERCIFHGGC
jgi:hypothetical protein